MDKTVEYYVGLPYTIELRNEAEDAGWFVRVKELRGCMSEGDTANEALDAIQEAMELWLEVALDEGIPIPEPRVEEDYSGKFVVRVPRSLHRELVDEATRQGTSLNQHVNVALARSVGRPIPAGPAMEEEPGWPGLKTAVRQALLAAGLTEEAGELDERLFASWAAECLGQAESALHDGHLRDGLWCLKALANGLNAGEGVSPVISVFRRTVSLLNRQVERVVRLQQGAMNDMEMRSKISTVVQGANRSLAQSVIQEERVAYSESSVQVGSPLEELFGQPRPSSKW